jgi:hypothetical protein
MEYSLLKTIENGIGCPFIPNESYPRLTPFPATDFVNPGLGQISRLHDFYVPLYSNRHLHEKHKKVNNLDNLEGSGVSENETVDTNDQIMKDQDNLVNDLKEDPVSFNLEKRKRLGDAIHESFLHPKLIKTDTLILKKPVKSETTKPQSTNHYPKSIVKHKFKLLE